MINTTFDCLFCGILTNQTRDILEQGEGYFIFQDIQDGSATFHILICPTDHIPNVNSMDKEFDLSVLNLLEKKGYEYLQRHYPGQQFKFGYHKPPFYSIDHLHLHGFVLPFRSCWKATVKYGWFLYSTEDIKTMVKNKLQRISANL